MGHWTSAAKPLLSRFRSATFGAPDLGRFEGWYAEWLGYRTRERGTVSVALAASWGAPDAAGSRFVLMNTDGADDVFLRAIEAPAIPGYRALTTFGWNACEIIVDDVHALAARLRRSPFEILAGPNPLQFMRSIEAMQVIGPAGECLYFTMEGGDRATSILPRPRSFIDRPFILVVAGPDFSAMHRWWIERFQLRQRPVRDATVAIIQQAQGLDPGDSIPLTTLGLAEHGFLIELDGYTTGPGRVAAPRPVRRGALPQGNAIGSFVIDDLARVADIAITAPADYEGLHYAGRKACTVLGPAGERVELVQSD